MWGYQVDRFEGRAATSAMVLLIASVGCGGSEVPAQAPPAAAYEQTNASSPPEEEATTGEAAGTDAACRGERCFRCGDAVCLPGFYCDEQREVCSWLPQCQGNASCECVEQALGDCSCQARDEGVFVECP